MYFLQEITKNVLRKAVVRISSFTPARPWVWNIFLLRQSPPSLYWTYHLVWEYSYLFSLRVYSSVLLKSVCQPHYSVCPL